MLNKVDHSLPFPAHLSYITLLFFKDQNKWKVTSLQEHVQIFQGPQMLLINA